MKKLSWDDSGVASTVGTIMALMIFLTFLSMFTNQYVPVWMEDNEAAHMNVVESQFSNLKWSMDIQMMLGMLYGSSEVAIYTPITMGAQGVPMFASPTLGQLTVNPNPQYSRCNVEFLFNSGGGISQKWENASGTIKLYAANRYYVQQTLVYENDAIILDQNEGELVKVPSQLVLRREGARYHMAFTLVSMIGNNQSYAGFDTRGVQTLLRFAQGTTYEDAQTNMSGGAVDGLPDNNFIYINQTTQYGDAWYAYFNKTMADYGLNKGTQFDISRTTIIADPQDPLEKISLRIQTNIISSFTLNTAYFDILLSESGVGG